MAILLDMLSYCKLRCSYYLSLLGHLRKQSQAHPLPTGLPLHPAIHFQSLHGSPTDSRLTMDGAVPGNELKMFFPEILPRMKEPNRTPRFLVGAGNMIGFADVTRSASQGEIGAV